MTDTTNGPNLSAHGYDLSTVRLMGAYPATECPVKTQFKYQPPEGVTPAPVSEILQAAFDAGNEFEALIFERLQELHPKAVHIEENDDLRVMTDATVAAMDRQTPIILGGCLPADVDGRRTGKPDMLLFDGDGYLPIDVKLYALLLDPDPEGKAVTAASHLDFPSIDDALPTGGSWNSGKRKKAAFQLAHYWRMLQACGRASSRGAWGGILDANEFIVWIDLNAPDGTIQNKKTFEDEPVTWLRAYDHEFEFRRDVAAHTVQRVNGADVEPKVLPVWIGECGSCEWNVRCRPDLEARDHISLLPFMSYWQYRPLRIAGITTRRQIAERDYFTASIVSSLTDAQKRRLFDDTNADELLSELWRQSKSIQPLVDDLAAAGTMTAGDLRARLTDQLVLELDGALSPKWIDQARASVRGTPLLARGFTGLDLPTYDVEVDFDMENDLDRNVYMWGVLVTNNGERQPYQAFDAYEPDVDGSGAQLEAEVFRDFWNEAHRLLSEATEGGQTFQLFYWTGAELTQAKRIAELGAIDGLPTVDEVEAFFGEHCTDLEAVLRKHFITANGTSVKVIAPFAGHDWSAVYALTGPEDEAEAAGGDTSMIKHRLAVESETPEARHAAIKWLRTYNEADVEATRKVRAWMRTSIHELPRAEALDR